MSAEDNYWKTEGTRLLNPDASIPSIEDRVKAAFVAGREYERNLLKIIIQRLSSCAENMSWEVNPSWSSSAIKASHDYEEMKWEIENALK